MEFQKISVPSPPPLPNTRRATKILREGGGGSKRRQFSRGWRWGGLSSLLFFLGGELRVRSMSKQTVIIIVIYYYIIIIYIIIIIILLLLLIGVPKQTLMFSSMIFYWRSAECFFHGLHDSLCNPIVVGL